MKWVAKPCCLIGWSHPLFFLFFLIVVKYTSHKISHLNHFYMSQVHSQFCATNPQNSSFCKIETPCLLNNTSWPLAPTVLLCITMNWLLQLARITKLTQYLSVCDWLVSVSLMFSGFTHVCQNCLPFWGWTVFHYMHVPHFICPLICWWTLGLRPSCGHCV